MPKSRIIVTKRWPDAVETAMAERYDVLLNHDNSAFDVARMRKALLEADAICPTVTDALGPEVFDGLEPRAKIIGNLGVGYSHIDAGGAARAGITITNTPDVLSDCTADLAMTLMLMAARRAGEGERMIRSNNWHGWAPDQLLGHSVTGKTLGIVGFGRIGQAMAKRARFGFRMKVLALKRSAISPEILTETGAIQTDNLKHILAESDFLSLHCPGGTENRHLIGALELAEMKPTAFLINTARGEVVDENALVGALENGRLAGAGLDVFEEEPRVHPGLMRLENVVLLPHLGSATIETREAMGFRVLDNLNAFFDGDTPADKVN